MATNQATATQQPARPELFFGLVAPIGCDIGTVERELEDALTKVGYRCHFVNLTAEMYDLYLLSCRKKGIKPEKDKPQNTEQKISFGNYVRSIYKQRGILGVGALRVIRRIRQYENYPNEITVLQKHIISRNAGTPLDGHAFIIRQFKRREETQILADLYGRQFIQVSVTDTRDNREKRLNNKLKQEFLGLSDEKISQMASRLISIDEDESLHISESMAPEEIEVKREYGQRIGDIFQFGDVFIDGASRALIKDTTIRFIDALFGRNDISPSVEEFGAYMAKAVSLRSVDLSRQVGAVLMNDDGDAIAMGCNEVPRPRGGIYSDNDPEKHRDIDDGVETNKLETNRIIRNFLDVLSSKGLLSKKPEEVMTDAESRKAILDSMVGDITEYGRMVHAEMNALTDAARNGRSVRGTTCFVTTFPCHNCAKHLISAGVSAIVFIEPYPKSKTLDLYSYALTHNQNEHDKVLIKHFTGISPRRFRDIFEKGKRRRSDGTIKVWDKESPFPAVPTRPIFYTPAELDTILRAVK